MNELEATRSKLKCLEMVEGTKLDWWKCIKHQGYILIGYPTALVADKKEYEFALGVVEGKPVWEGDTLYHPEYGEVTLRLRGGTSRYSIKICKTSGVEFGGMEFLSPSFSWNPPTQKNQKTEKLQELLAIQKSSCDCVSDNYFRGMYNGMEVMLACVEEREAKFINKPSKTVMVELTVEDARHIAHDECVPHYSVVRMLYACKKALEQLK